MTASSFVRAKPSMGCSLARWRQRKDHAELLNQLWVSVLEGDFILQGAKSIADADGPPAAVLKVKSTASPRVGHNMAELRKRIKEGQSWERLFTLLMAVSALERFMLAISTAAVESDPLRTPGFPKMLDGLALKKRAIQVPQPNLTPVVKGDWGARISSLERMFGTVPTLLKDSRNELEAIRRMRNSIAHDFGSKDADGTMPPSVALIAGARSDRLAVPKHGLSQDRLIKWLQLLTDISIALDTQLTIEHIGEYEIPAIYLDWKSSPDTYEKSLGITLKGTKKVHDQRFSNFISGALSAGYSSSYVRSMEQYIANV